MADTPKLVLPEIASAQAQKEVTHNESLRLIDGLLQCCAIDKDLSAPPGSPADGALYIVGGSASGAWAGHDYEIAYYSSTAWVFSTPAHGWLVYVQDESSFYLYTGDSLEYWIPLGENLPEAAYDINASKAGQPGTSEVVLTWPMVRSITFDDDFDGSVAVAGTAAGDSGGATFSIKLDGVEVGTLFFDEAETAGVFTSDSGGVSFAAGEVLTIVAPASQDSTLADIGVVLAGKLA